MSLVGFKGKNHPQQVGRRGALDKVDDRKTPPKLFDPLNERFKFTLDVAASPENTQCRHFFTAESNGLAQQWFGRVWCNPPYSNLGAWCGKAWAEWYTSPGVQVIVMLLPANRTEQAWWQDWIEPERISGELEIEFLRGRQRFILPGCDGIEPNQRPPFGVCLAIWGPR